MPSLNVSVAYRPLRIGFLIRSSSIEDFLYAVAVNTSLWGGLHNPILPVPEEGDFPSWIEVVIRRFQVDVLMPVTNTEPISNIVGAHRYLDSPSFYGEGNPLLQLDQTEAPRFKPLDIAVPLTDLWRRELRHQKDSSVVAPSWNANHDFGLVFAAQFGVFPRADSGLPNLHQGFLEITDAAQPDLSAQRPAADWVEKEYPITLTTVGLTHHDTLAHHDSGIVLGDPSNLEHLAAFWNLRAAGADVLYIPVRGISFFEEWANAHLGQLARSGPRWVPDQEPYVHVWEFSTERSRRDLPDEVRELLPASAKIARARLSPSTWEQPSLGNLPPSTTPITTLASAEERYGGPHVSLQLGDGPFPEGQVRGKRQYQNWVLTLHPITVGSLPPASTLRLPLLRDLNEWYSRQIVPPDPGSLRVQPRGFDLITEVWERTLSMSPVPIAGLVTAVLQRAGVGMTESFAGRLSRRILGMMGGLQGANLFRIRGVRKLLAHSKARDGIRLRHAHEVIRDVDETTRRPTFERFSRYWREATPQTILRGLLDREVLRPGLELLCPSCELSSFIEAERIGNRVSCPLCGHSFLLGPQLRAGNGCFGSPGCSSAKVVRRVPSRRSWP